MVLHRGTGEGQALASLQAPRGGGRLARGVLDGLGLVEDHQVEVDLRELGLVSAEGAVGREEDVRRLGAVQCLQAVGARVVHDPEVGGEALGLGAPVEDHRAGRDHERGPALFAAPCSVQEVGEDLDRLAETHVIREAAAQPQVAELLQPAKPLALVGAEFADERLGLVHGHGGGGFAQEGAKVGEGLVHLHRVEGGLALEQRREDPALLLAEADLAVLGLSHLQELPAGGPVLGEQAAGAVGEGDELGAALRRRQERGERDLLALERHVPVQVEPVDP